MWRYPLTSEPVPVDGAQMLWALLRGIESLPPLFANPLRPAMPASPAWAGEEGDQTCRSGRMEPSHA